MSHIAAGRTATEPSTSMLLMVILCTGLYTATIAAATAPAPKDRHYNTIGFFDIHVGNRSNHPLSLPPA